MSQPTYRVLLMDGQEFETRGVPRETTYKLQFETGDGRRINVPLANVQFWERLDSESAINDRGSRVVIKGRLNLDHRDFA